MLDACLSGCLVASVQCCFAGCRVDWLHGCWVLGVVEEVSRSGWGSFFVVSRTAIVEERETVVAT
jgi:hypothetical protein